MLLSEETKEENIVLFSEKLCRIVEAYEFSVVKHITVSIGVSICDSSTDKELFLKKVDDALYEAKESGRNRVAFH